MDNSFLLFCKNLEKAFTGLPQAKCFNTKFGSSEFVLLFFLSTVRSPLSDCPISESMLSNASKADNYIYSKLFKLEVIT